MTGYAEFEFDLPSALLTNLLKVLDALDPAPLDAENLAAVPEQQGVYQLLLDHQVVYIGKTDAEAGLHRRLVRHARKILHRHELSPERVTFRAIRIFVFTAMDLESDLIRAYGGVKSLAWNGSGFGSNDPGRERDTTRINAENYDARYTINIDREIAFSIENGETAATALLRLKSALPYTLRYEGGGGRGRRPKTELDSALVSALSGPVTARRAIMHILRALEPGWQATRLPGYIILYKEKREYPLAEIIAST